MSRQAVSKWELDAASPDTDNIIQLSRLFGVTTDWLLIGEEAVPTVTASPPQSKADPRPNAMLTRAAQIVLIVGGVALVTLLFIFGLSLLANLEGIW